MTALSRQFCFKLGMLATTLVLSACSNASQRSPFPTPPPPLPAETARPAPTPEVVNPAPTSTVPVNTYERGLDKAASATTLARDAQTPEDWKLVISQWQRSIEFLKAVPKNNPDYKAAQKLLPGYQQQLAIAQQRAKYNPRQTTVARGKTETGGIPLLASGDGATAVGNISSINQQQVDFFTQKKKFSASLTELGSSVPPETPSYNYTTSGDAKRAITVAIARRDGLPSYTGVVYVVNNGTTNIPVTGICATQQNSRIPPGVPTLNGTTVICPSGSLPV